MGALSLPLMTGVFLPDREVFPRRLMVVRHPPAKKENGVYD